MSMSRGIWSGPSPSLCLDTTECIIGEKTPGCYFAHVQNDLNLRFLRMFECMAEEPLQTEHIFESSYQNATQFNNITFRLSVFLCHHPITT